jgi:hypothetical protein
MAIAAPTLQKSVYNRIPFMVENDTNTELILSFAAEVMGELYKVFDISDADMLDDTKYSILQKSLIADLASIQILMRQSLLNGEGNGSNAAAGNKMLKRAKAGETEAEFAQLKASDGTKLLMTASQLAEKYMNDALRKARTMGFILDIKQDGEFVVSVMSHPLPPMSNISYD